MTHQNDLGQPIGFPVPDWQGCNPPPRTPMVGRTCRVEPLDPDKHGAQLHAANETDKEGRIWTYLHCGPFETEAEYRDWLVSFCLTPDPFFHAVVDTNTEQAVGIASYLRINASMGVIEVGHINYSLLLQGTIAGTEAMYLMMRRVFDELGYRRYEWKCDALNEKSCRAAERLGFQYEGTFKQALVYKGRNRDTAWYAMIDQDWPKIKEEYERWLNPGNFDDGVQRTRLSI